jgi:uncharacterized protein YndB with AHSA1/START domain
MDSNKSKSIKVETFVKGSSEKVWDCFTDPGHITGWYFAADSWHAPKAENDLRAGGKFSITMAARDGSASFDFCGVYTEVTPFNKIAYELADGRKVIICFIKTEKGIHVTEEFDPESVNSEELQRSGWQSILDNFKKYAENS